MFNPNKTGQVTDDSEKKLRYPKTEEGLRANVRTIARLLDVAKMLPKGEATFSSDIQFKRKSHKRFLGFILSNDPNANLDKTVGYGAALEVAMIIELENLFDEADDDFVDKAEIIEKFNPEAYSAIKGEVEKHLNELTKAIEREKESAEFEHIVGPYMKLHELINPLFTTDMENTLLDWKVEEAEKKAEANKELASLIGKL